MTNPLYTISTLPADDQAAIREFNDRYIAAIGAAPAPTWADLGDLFPSSSPMVTFPVSNFALKYQQTEGENRFKTFLSKSFDLKGRSTTRAPRGVCSTSSRRASRTARGRRARTG